MVFDDLLVLGNAFNERQQLLEQIQHETCLRARGDCVGLQVRSVQLLINLGCHFGRVAVRSFSQGGLQVFDRGRHGTLRSGISLQKCQGRALLQRGLELQHHRVVDFEAGGQPFRQARLYLDQVILITGEPFQFGHQGTVRFQSLQIGDLGSTIFGEQIGYDAVGLGSRCRTPLIDRLGIDRIDRKAGHQQGVNQEVMICFDNTCHVCLTVRTAYGRQNLPQFDESCHGVSHLVGTEPTSRLSKDQDVVFRVRPIDACKPPMQCHPCVDKWFLNKPGPFTVASKTRLSHHRFSRNSRGRKAFFLHRSSRLEELVFRFRHPTRNTSKCTLASALPSRGLASSLL
jgi:hypothetical protein